MESNNSREEVEEKDATVITLENYKNDLKLLKKYSKDLLSQNKSLKLVLEKLFNILLITEYSVDGVSSWTSDEISNFEEELSSKLKRNSSKCSEDDNGKKKSESCALLGVDIKENGVFDTYLANSLVKEVSVRDSHRCDYQICFSHSKYTNTYESYKHDVKFLLKLLESNSSVTKFENPTNIFSKLKISDIMEENGENESFKELMNSFAVFSAAVESNESFHSAKDENVLNHSINNKSQAIHHLAVYQSPSQYFNSAAMRQEDIYSSTEDCSTEFEHSNPMRDGDFEKSALINALDESSNEPMNEKASESASVVDNHDIVNNETSVPAVTSKETDPIFNQYEVECVYILIIICMLQYNT
jgi:hypothetical protein